MAKKKSEYDLGRGLADLQGYTKRLTLAFGADLFRSAPICYPAAPVDNRLEYAKAIVRIAARRYGVPIANLRIRFSNQPVGTEAGSLRQAGDHFYLDVLKRYRDDDLALHAIIAHEVAHYALAKRLIRLPDAKQNEELTDTLVVLGGFGPLALQAYYTEINVRSEREERSAIFGLGYLHPTALAYLILVQAEVAGVREGLESSLRSPWFVEPKQFWQELVKQRRTEDAPTVPACLVCGELLPLPDPGANRLSTCHLCRYTQPYPPSLHVDSAGAS